MKIIFVNWIPNHDKTLILPLTDINYSKAIFLKLNIRSIDTDYFFSYID